MLKGIPKIISPELMKILMEMGHGDEIVLADGNFPAASCASKLIRYDGHGVPEILDAILKFFPLDTFVPTPVALMEIVEGDDYNPEIWNEFKTIMSNYNALTNIEYLERQAFYKKTKEAYAVIATSESARYANIILKKGIIEK